MIVNGSGTTIEAVIYMLALIESVEVVEGNVNDRFQF